MDFNTLQIGIEKNVARIALNRPDMRNALNVTMIKELTEAVDWLDTRDDIRAIEICGNGRSFCAGADINYMRDIAQLDYQANVADARLLSRLFQTIYFCNTPVIALVHGHVIGGGNGIIAACDVVLAESDTVFAFSEVKLGITPATISPFVMARCGEAMARDVMVSGRKFTAQEALHYHLANHVGTMEELNKLLDSYIDSYLAASADTISDCKQLIRMTHGLDRNSSIFETTANLIARERMSKDGQERMKKFLEK